MLITPKQQLYLHPQVVDLLSFHLQVELVVCRLTRSGSEVWQQNEPMDWQVSGIPFLPEDYQHLKEVRLLVVLVPCVVKTCEMNVVEAVSHRLAFMYGNCLAR